MLGFGDHSNTEYSFNKYFTIDICLSFDFFLSLLIKFAKANLRTSSSGVFVLVEGLRKSTALLRCFGSPSWGSGFHLPQLRTNVRGNNTVLARYFAGNSSPDCFLFAVTPAYLSDARVVRVQRGQNKRDTRLTVSLLFWLPQLDSNQRPCG